MGWRGGQTRTKILQGQSFLLLFFKKEALPFLAASPPWPMSWQMDTPERAPGPDDYLARLNPEQRARGGNRGRPAAGAGRRGHRQDAGADHALRPHPADPPRVPEPGAGRHLHQQGGARDARAGLGALLGRPAEGLWLGTFHALCARMLRRHAEMVGLTSTFTILDADDQLRLLKQVMEAHRSTQALGAAGADGRHPALEGPRPHARPGDAGRGHRLRRAASALAVYGAYQQRLRELNAADFGDLPLHMTELLRTRPEVLAQYHRDVPLHPGGRVPGHQRGAVPVAAAAGAGAPQHLLRGRRRPVDLLVARRRGREHPALRARLPGRARSSGWRATTAPPSRSSARRPG